MATYYVNDAGSNTSPYDTKAKGATLLQTAYNLFVSDATTGTINIVNNGSSYTGLVSTSFPNAQTLTISVIGNPVEISSRISIDSLTTGTINISNVNITSSATYALAIHQQALNATNCRITASQGGILNNSTSGNMVSCIVIATTLSPGAAGIYSVNSEPDVDQCTIVGFEKGIDSNGTGSIDVYNTIISGCTIGIEKTSGTLNLSYSCLNNTTDIASGPTVVETSNIYSDPLFLNTSDYYLLSTSPCIMAGDPSYDASSEPGGGLGIINIGRWGGTVYATIPTWAALVGWGTSYGNYFGGYISNENESIEFNSTYGYWTFIINRIEVAYLDLNGTTIGTCFTNTKPTAGTPPTNSAEIMFDDSNNRIEFQKDGVTICYVSSAGKQFGAP